MLNSFLVLSIFLFSNSTSDNFEGIIKYCNVKTNDSLIYYITNDKIRIERKGEFVAKYGNYTDQFLDLKNNRSILYNAEKGEYNFFDGKRTYFPPEELNKNLTILNQSCQGYKIDYGEVGYGSRMQDKIYVSNDLYFTKPKNCTIQNILITNGTGKITLKQIRLVEGPDYFGETIWEAVEIIPMEIPDSLLLF